MYFKKFLALAAFGLHTTALLAQNVQREPFSFNDMLDGSLGDMPAMWLVTHGALASLNSTKTYLTKRSEISSAAATPTAPAGRDKEDGAALGAFIGASLTAPIKVHDSGSKLKGFCQTLVAGSAGMVGAVIGQEAGKRIYGTNSSAPDFEEGLVPGTFIGGVIGTAVGTALTKSLCEIGAPGFKEFIGDLDDLGLEGVETIMAESYLQAIDATLHTLGVEPARIIRFSGQIQQALRFVHLRGPAEGVEQLTRALTRESAEMANAVADGTLLASPAISSLAGFSSITGAALGLSPVLPPPVFGAPALGQLSAITSQLSAMVGFSNTMPTIPQSPQVQAAADALRDGISLAATAPSPGLTSHARSALKKASKLTHGLLDALDLFRPGKSICHRKEHTSVITTTRTHTSTITKTRDHTSMITAMREHTSVTTATREHTATVVKTVEKQLTKTRTMKLLHVDTVIKTRTLKLLHESTVTRTVRVEAEPTTVTVTATPSTFSIGKVPIRPPSPRWCFPPRTTWWCPIH